MAKKGTKKKPDSRKTVTKTTGSPRQLKEPKYKSFHLQRSIKPYIKRPKLPHAWRLFGRACRVLGRHWKLFGGILLVYALLNVVLVGGFSSGDLGTVKSTYNQIFTGHFSGLATGLALFAVLANSAGSAAGSAAGAYQTSLLVVFSLVLIWALRQVYGQARVGIRDSFYKGTYPLVQFVLVLVVIGLQLLPLVIGTSLYTLLVGGGIIIYTAGKVLIIALAVLLALLSIYMVLSSVFALYIVTLPDMTPLKALRSARELVRYRRWPVLRKIIFLAVAIVVIMAAVVAPLAVFATSLATVLFFLLSVVALAVIHSYMYALYRELIQ